MLEPCPFCAVPVGAAFHEGDLVRGLWDAYPVTPGHVLLVPRRHVASWFDATREEQIELLDAVEIARAAIAERFGADGFNLGVNIGAAAGQTVPHLHLHVIPRRIGDMADPRGGVRHVIPSQGNYLAEPDAGQMVHEGSPSAWPQAGADPAVVGGQEDPLLPHLVAHLDRAVEADLLVAFVLESGVAAVENALRGFLMRGGRLRLVTGDYLGVTDPRALRRLLDLEAYVPPGESEVDDLDRRFQLRAFETGTGSFHPKAYLFRFESSAGSATGRGGIAYVGSSNLTRTALVTGLEWNYRVVLERDRAGFGEVEQSFEALFTAPRTQPLDLAWIEKYEQRRPERVQSPDTVPEEPPAPPPVPHVVQQEALTALETTRREGNRSGLVVMATGLGKTWLAAFDVERMGSRRVLFVAHREEILRQARSTFRRILPRARLGVYGGGRHEADADILFASIQTLGRRDHLDRFAPSAFDYIVVDEFHHAAAQTYRRLIEHFLPSFLLGLTATPERTDGGSLLALCGENLVYRCDLFEGIRRAPDRLVPFHYFGVPDAVDYQNIPWRNRRFDPGELEQALATVVRADNALEQWRDKAGARTLGFCCSMAHADFMARHFEAEGVKAVAVHSGPTSAPRATSLDRLADGRIEVLFAVDILNEGVDIPDVDTVLMLRPTESRIVFLQQLGRGLRAAPGKPHLTVIDYIGNHRSFKMKPQVLLELGVGDAELRRVLRELETGGPESLDLPTGCEVTYELEAIRLLEGQLVRAQAAESLTRWYMDFEERVGSRPLALDAFHESRNPRSARASHGSWLRFVAAHGGVDARIRDLLGAQALAADFLDELERTRMSRSFKMLVLLAMLREGGFPRPIALEDLTRGFRVLAERSAKLRKEVRPGLEDERALQAYLLENPIQAWCNAQRGARVYFERAGGVFSPCFSVPPELAEEYAAAVRELAEWRLADHLSGRPGELDAGWRIICKVIQTNGRPILKLPSREHFHGIPKGDLPVRVEGREYLARFVKIAVNFLAPEGSEGNALADVMRSWFGADAGQPGTRYFVAFTHSEEGWELTPLAPAEASRAIVEHAVQRTAEAKVVSADGRRMDATYHLESAEGQLSIVFHSRGGTGGTAAAINTEYAAGLERLLQRLQDAGLTLEAIYLDTSQTQEASLEDRLLRLRGERPYPLDLRAEQDLEDLRRGISAAQGNNPNRRIRMVVGGQVGGGVDALETMLGAPDGRSRRGAGLDS